MKLWRTHGEAGPADSSYMTWMRDRWGLYSGSQSRALSRQTRTWVVAAEAGSGRGVWGPFPVSVLGLRAEEGEELRSVTCSGVAHGPVLSAGAWEGQMGSSPIHFWVILSLGRERREGGQGARPWGPGEERDTEGRSLNGKGGESERRVV